MPGWVLRAEGVEVAYGEQRAVAGVTLGLAAGETVAVTGSSGSGKSSLLHCLAGIVPASAGTVRFGELDYAALGDDELSALRRERFGYVFQHGELLPELTVEENAALPLRLAGRRKDAAHAAAAPVLHRLGLDALRGRRVSRLSGGQAQRVAVARALVHRPAVVFADEPTGALDSVNAAAVLDEFLSLARDAGTAVLLVTHDEGVAARADRRCLMHDGRLRDLSAVPAPTPSADPGAGAP
ncbi:ABC transporter ATP-binding protein [Streptomyces sp. DSM 41982]|uniref:ABC transporter ATP-binding protein n=1 Tax=Streptomyces evansiae TaxID=3075535 RepID=A0ABD5EB97_9ACTN|nr:MULTISPECIES: ABC transporter ATP-binding protein [unclassified Streptomyces]MDT0418720.1 ABC transporter ATP-binding protein [Streptomyces sp. DSM 41982]SCE18701.1 putative ABC transport system ATP-binding protein [Streptomyces sp. SolWspMP-sol7th]